MPSYQALLVILFTIMSKNDYITFDELINVFETDNTDNNYKTSADLLLTSVTDWLTENLSEPADLILELNKRIKKPLTFDNLEKYSKTLLPKNDAWEIEAINNILEMFDFERKNIIDTVVELDAIIVRITEHYRAH